MFLHISILLLLSKYSYGFLRPITTRRAQTAGVAVGAGAIPPPPYKFRSSARLLSRTVSIRIPYIKLAARKGGVDGVNVDDVIAAMGLTQVKKKKKISSTNMNTSDGEISNNNGTEATQTKKKKNKKKKKMIGPKTDTNKKNIVMSQSESISSMPSSSLQKAKDISLQIQLEYAREGHTSIRNMIPPDVIEEVYKDLKAYSTNQKYRQNGEDSAPFLQFYNTWRDLPSVKRLVTSPSLCQAASTLMGMGTGLDKNDDSPSLRLYQDSVFIKRKNKDGITPWHIDGRMMPFDSSNVITFWIPLHAIPSIEDGGTGLLFINKSHSDFSLPYWNGRGTDYEDDGHDYKDDNEEDSYNAYENLTGRYGIQNVGNDRIVDNNPGVIGHHMPLNIGDCTVHNGWTMHCANGNKKNIGKMNMNKNKNSRDAVPFQTRYAIAISYVDSHAEVRGDIPGVGKNVMSHQTGGRHRNRSLTFLGDAEDRASYAEWIGDILPRTQFQHELLPDVWPRR